MKIAQAEIFESCPGRNFTTLRLTTDDGVIGHGDATLNGRPKAVVAYLQDHLFPLLIGEDASRIEHIWQTLYKGAYWRRGPVTMAALAAIDMALWDIKGKALDQPVYQLLGGRSRDRLLVYGHASGFEIGDAVDAVARLRDEGYEAIRVQCAVPGQDLNYGVAPKGQDSTHYAPGLTDKPAMHTWRAEEYLTIVPRLFEAVRERFGETLRLLHDTHHRLLPIQAAKLAKRLDPFDLFWLEDLCAAENQEVFRLIRQHSTTPLALGEVFNSIHDCDHLLREQLIDFVRMAATHSGGITHLRRIFDLAGHYMIRTGCHGAPDISPIGMAAQYHLGLWAPNFGIQEYHVCDDPRLATVFRHEHRLVDGHIVVSDAPGLGVGFDAARAAEHPPQPNYVSLNRLPDGTAWSY